MKRLVKFERDLVMKVKRFMKFTFMKIRLTLLIKIAARRHLKIQ